MNEDKVEGKAMCYGIRELTGKKTRESNSIRRTGSPEVIEQAKMETMVRAWLKKWTPKRSARQEGKASGGRISGIAGGGGRRFFPLPPWRWVNM